MDNLNSNEIVNQLKNMGIDLSKLNKKQVNQLIDCTKGITDISQVTPNILDNLSKILNIKLKLNNNTQPKKKTKKIKRNDKCPCNSGKKYKNCCLNKEYIKNQSPMDSVNIETFSSNTQEINVTEENQEPLVFDVNIDATYKETQQIYVYPNESVEESVEKFSKTHELSDLKKEKLIEHLKQNITKLKNKE
jgi:hypothetical protein